MPNTICTSFPPLTGYELNEIRRGLSARLSPNGYSSNDIAQRPEHALVPCRDCGCTELPASVMSWVSEPAYVGGDPRFPWLGDHAHWAYNLQHAYCDDCVSECEWCASPAALHGQSYSNVTLCVDCTDNARLCSQCGDGVRDHRAMYLGSRDEYYCDNCSDDYVASCAHCGTSYHVDDDPDCDCSESHLINSYGHKPDAVFRDINLMAMRLCGDDVSKPFMGFELEVESGNNRKGDGAELFQEIINDELVYLKEDSSLDDGFEIVTHPSTLDFYQNGFDWEPIQQLRDMKFKSWSTRTCGFHVHISRDAFYTKDLHRNTNASPHMYGFLLFIYKNAAEVEAISGRNSTYGRITDSELENAFAYSARRARSERYVAVNTSNRHTLELRCFKGSLNHDRIMGYLEFVDAVFHYTKTNRITKLKDSMDFLAFTQWCEIQPRYDNLLSLIHRSGALDAE